MAREKLIVPSMDFDSTIADTRHRWHMIDRTNGTDWEAYSLACVDDGLGPAYPWAKYLSDKGEPWIIVSGRSEASREVSMQWLHDRGLYPWAVFLCDERHSYMAHGEWKATRLKEIQRDNNWKIPFHVDDITEVAVAIEDDPELDFPTILVHTINSGVVDHLG